MLRRALELGVNHVDTADAYGPDVSEELIAEALHPYPDGLVDRDEGRARANAAGRRLAEGRAPRAPARRVRGRACAASGSSRSTVYYLHRPDPEVPYEESVGALKELKDEGKIRHVAVSNVSLERLATARGIVDIALVQNQYSLTDRRAQDVLDACERAASGSSLGAARRRRARPTGPVAEIARAHDASPVQVAMAWLLHTSPVMLPIPGTSSLDHLEENVAAAELALDAAEVAALDAMGH